MVLAVLRQLIYITTFQTKCQALFSYFLQNKKPLTRLLWYWSGRRDSNSRPSPWQGDALPLSHFRIFGRGRWIRTIESSANGFTVRPLWPLGNPSKLYWSWWRESNPQPADYKSAALPLSHTSIFVIKKLATWNGLEPSTSSVTGWHSNQLNYQAPSIY